MNGDAGLVSVLVERLTTRVSYLISCRADAPFFPC